MDAGGNMRIGLIGEKLGHSFSKPIHEALGHYTYELIPLSREEFPTFMPVSYTHLDVYKRQHYHRIPQGEALV